jgi:enoyl-[acyl-carrier protein] reductase II
MLMNPETPAFVKVVIEEKVPVVTTGAGNPGIYMDDLKAAGVKVIPVIGAPILAKRMEQLGADAVIAEGTESGGHVGEMTTMALVPQTCDSVSIPVIAAGGIADHRSFLAARALGACGVQIGTVLLGSEECPIHENYKDAIVKAKGSDTVVTGRIAGTPVRILKNEMSREYLREEKAGADRMELEKYTLGSLRKAVKDGDARMGSLMTGQACGLVHSIRPLKEIFAEIAGEV